MQSTAAVFLYITQNRSQLRLKILFYVQCCIWKMRFPILAEESLDIFDSLHCHYAAIYASVQTKPQHNLVTCTDACGGGIGGAKLHTARQARAGQSRGAPRSPFTAGVQPTRERSGDVRADCIFCLLSCSCIEQQTSD